MPAPSKGGTKQDEGRFVTIGEVKTLLDHEAKDRGEQGLGYEQKLAFEHSKTFARLTRSDAEKLVKDLVKIEKVTEWHAYRIADILPAHPDDVRAIFAKDRFTLEKAEIDRIIEAVKVYLQG